MIKKKSVLFIFILCSAWGFSTYADHAVGGNLMITTSSQDDVNTLISRANSRVGGISTSDMGSAWELNGHYTYRFGKEMYALQISPSFFYQVSAGSGTGGSYDYKLNGLTLFPMLRVYALENKFIKFFMQGGLGWGILYGDIEEGSGKVSFSGNAFGFKAGIGAEFCFTVNHCMNVEGNFRYLPIERNISSKYSGTFASNSVSQPPLGDKNTGVEVEIDGQDLKTTLSGIQGVIGYTYWF